MEEEDLDYVLVPLGLCVLGTYHVWLLITVLRHPIRTVIGLNAQSRHQWVLSMMSVSTQFLSFYIVLVFEVFILMGNVAMKLILHDQKEGRKKD